MTDARLPERWLNDRRFLRLSDQAHRAYINTLLWSVANRSDGLIERDDLLLVPGIDTGRADELVKAELWQCQADGWLIVDYAQTQTTRHDLEVLENARRREREKKARQRAARDAVPREHPPGTSPGNIPRDCTGRQDRQDRQAVRRGRT